jgi:ABC-type antimicrobial peptide transport system permease subunit
MGTLALLGLMLTALGTYAALATTMQARVPELAMRMVCGATPSQLMQLVVRQAIVLAGSGVGVGLCASWLLASRVIQGYFGADVIDAWASALAAAVILGTACVCAFAAARRVLGADLFDALRQF